MIEALFSNQTVIRIYIGSEDRVHAGIFDAQGQPLKTKAAAMKLEIPTMEILIRQQAKSDLRQAARWYEGQSPGLGREFVAEVEATLSRVVENPLPHQTIYRDVRRAIWFSPQTG